MALKPRSHPWWSRLHFLLRFLASTGLLAVLAGIAIAGSQGLLGSWADASQKLVDTARGSPPEGPGRIAAYLVLGGAALLALGLLVELLLVLRMTAGRRSATGFNALVQAGLAAAILVGINVYSFEHPRRADLTRDRRFTLPDDVQERLRRLRGETTVVVLQQRPRAEGGDQKLEAYRSAAEVVVVDRLRDLADQFRTLGAQFKVVVLDTRSVDFDDERKRVAPDDSPLARAIQNAPGNSIFFSAEEGEGKDKTHHVQRLSFDDFYQLDQSASLAAQDGRGNLVLRSGGVGPLARRLFNLDQKRPRVGVLVVHEAFSTLDGERDRETPWSLTRMRAALAQHGFDVRDVILKRLLPSDPRRGWASEPVVALLEETRYRRHLQQRDVLPRVIEEMRQGVKGDEAAKKAWQETSLRELARRTGLPPALVTESFRKRQLEAIDNDLEEQKAEIERLGKDLEEVKTKLETVDEDVVGEQLRTSDLTAKMERAVADCDLLMVVRPSIWRYNYPDDDGLHRLEPFQVNVIKDFLKAGKPVLACLGSVVDPPRGPDGIEELLGEFHVRAVRQVLMPTAQPGDGDREGLMRGDRSKVPPLDFKTGHDVLTRGRLPSAEDHPLRRKLARTSAWLGDQFALRLEYARPVHYTPPIPPALGLAAGPGAAALKEMLPAAHHMAEFLWTDVNMWNDDDPRAGRRFEAPKTDDPTRGTPEERRRGRFPVGVALESELPPEWRAEAKKVRLAVIGHGTPFADTTFEPANEKALLETCNWLLGRDDPLAGEPAGWSYPRLELAGPVKERWLWGVCLGLPLFFAWLGLIVLLARRMW